MILYKNVLSSDLLNDCINELENNKSQKCWQLSNFIWPNHILVGVTGICTISNISDQLQIRIKNELSSLNELFSRYRTYCQFYMWNAYSGISSHNDYIYQFGATIYLNKNWNIDHGGVFLWDENGETLAKVPEYNSMMLNDSKQTHRVTTITPNAPEPRMTIQIWGYSD